MKSGDCPHVQNMYLLYVHEMFLLMMNDLTDGEIVAGAGEGDLEGVMEGEEGGGWEVGDDDLDLPPDLVS